MDKEGIILLDESTRRPECRTLHGCMEHVRCMPLGQRWQYEYYTGIPVERLPRELFTIQKRRHCRAAKTA